MREHFRRGLDLAAIEANAAVVQTLFAMATSGLVPSATYFWLKCRCGWRETIYLEHAGSIGLREVPTEELERELAPNVRQAEQQLRETAKLLMTHKRMAVTLDATQELVEGVRAFVEDR